ncbi:hypothetical protein SVAN01_07043 [Stagonosporopsis vannaccii]|nr:hypothetical protein SVAN01_07043 [Stagonosporopsis vannaccii]
MLSVLFKQAGPQPPVEPPPPYRVQVSTAPRSMVFHNNKLMEIPTWDEVQAELRERSPPPPPRTSAEEAVKQEKSSYQKVKRGEIEKMQTLHKVSPVDAARAVSKEDIDFLEPFQGFNFTSTNAYNRSAHFYQQAFPSGGMSYQIGMPDAFDSAESLSGDTAMPNSFYPDGVSYFYPDNADQIDRGGLGPFDHADTDQNNYNGGDSTHHNAGPTYDTEWVLLHGSGSVQTCYNGSVPAHQDNVGLANHGGLGPLHHDVTDQTHDSGWVSIQHNNAGPAAHHQNIVSAPSLEESDFAASESEDERPRKVPKLNKDGAPRKPRQPRAKLLKWTDDDWKNVLLGIVWACGETGVQIPFEQAAQVVGETCTAGALQQALLKLRVKQIAEGHKIPSLRMAWTRKNKYAVSKASQEPEANRLRKNPTRVEAIQAHVIKVPRAYNDEDRQGMARPYKWKKASRKAKFSALQSPANVKQEVPDASFTYNQAGGIHGYGLGLQTPTVFHGSSYVPASRRRVHEFSPAGPFGHRTGQIQGMTIGDGELASLLTTEGIEQHGIGLTDVGDEIFSTE